MTEDTESLVPVEGEFADTFFAPAPSDLIDSLLGQYREQRNKIDQVADIVAGELGNIIHYFLSGNDCDKRGYSSLTAERLFQRDGAVAALNAAYWSKALALTDVLECMPQARRDAWNSQITEMTAPEFTEDAVRPTIETLLSARAKFLAERVDGIFRALSGEHVTNSPMAFGKRMIVNYVLDAIGANISRAGIINDLRCVIARFMGRGELRSMASYALLNNMANRSQWGEWVSVDGGALRIRLYKKGTAHLEVHPDMAWRLNSILASLYPMAIPAEYRTKPNKPNKEFPLINRPLPFAVLDVLESNIPPDGCPAVSLTKPYRVWDATKAMDEAGRVLAALGGTMLAKHVWEFNYAPREVLQEVVVSGCIPDQVAHQYYPTPAEIAHEAIMLAEIGLEHSCLEPSAGTGAIAGLLPKERTTCIEVSPLYCKVLAAKGFLTLNVDFITWSRSSIVGTRESFDRVVMNPPFDRGRWQAHVEAAAGTVKLGGRLVAILPPSAKGVAEKLLPGWQITWGRQFTNAFVGTSVSVVILVAIKK